MWCGMEMRVPPRLAWRWVVVFHTGGSKCAGYVVWRSRSITRSMCATVHRGNRLWGAEQQCLCVVALGVLAGVGGGG